MNSHPRNIIEVFEQIERKYAKRPFAVTNKIIKYSQLCNSIRRITSIYNDLGLTQGNKVVLSTKDDILTSIIFISLIRNGIIAILLDTETKPQRAQRIMGLIEPDAVFLDESLAKTWKIPDRASIILINEQKRSIVKTLLRKNTQDDSLQSLLEKTSPAKLPDSIDSSTTAYILFTSGSTLNPKGVCISHHSLFTHLSTLSNIYEIIPESRLLNLLPLSHTDGIIQGPVLSFFNASSWFRPFKFSIQNCENILDLIFREKITHFFAVPTILSFLCQYGRSLNDSFQNGVFKYTLSSGALLEEKLWKKYEKIFQHSIINVYGLTETVAGGLFTEPNDPNQLGTIGKPVDCSAKIVNENGSELNIKESGELLIKGENVMQRYLNESEITNDFLQNGWLYTGDIAMRDDNGNYKILGRKKSLIISGGFNIHPEEVNEVLSSHPAVTESTTFGEPDPIWGERVVCAAVLTDDSTGNELELINFCRKSLEERKIPISIYLLDSIPKTTSGKIDLAAVRELTTKITNPSIENETKSVELKLLKLATDCFKVNIIDLSLDSSENEMVEWDSLAHLFLIAKVEESFSIRFSPADVINVKTLRDLYKITYRLIREFA